MGADSKREPFAPMGHWIRKEFVTLRPIFLFFLVGFLLLISLIKLSLRQFSIEVAVLSNAVVGALLAAKAALLIDETPLARSLERYRRIFAIAAKVFFYGSTCLILLYLERFLEALNRTRNLNAATAFVRAHETRYLMLAWALGISIIFALYFVFVEISRHMGDGELWKLFTQTRGPEESSVGRSSLRKDLQAEDLR